MSKRVKVSRPAAASDPSRGAVSICYSDGDGYSMETVLRHCRQKLGLQGGDVCYAPQCGTGVHGVLTFGEAEQAIFASKGLIETTMEASGAPHFFVIVCPMVVHDSGLLIPGRPGATAASVFQTPFGWSRMSAAQRSQHLQGRLPQFMIVSREQFGSLFLTMANIQRPQRLYPVFQNGLLEFQDSGHYAATLEQTLSGPTRSDSSKQLSL